MSNWASARGGSKPSTTAYAIPFPPVGERFDRLTEQLHIITGLWTTPVGEKFDYSGSHYTVAESPALPKPVQSPHPPIIIGGAGAKRTPALAAKFAAEFNVPFAPPDTAKTLFERVGRGVHRRRALDGLDDVLRGVRGVRRPRRRGGRAARRRDRPRGRRAAQQLPGGGHAGRDRRQARRLPTDRCCNGSTCSFWICPTSTTWSSSPAR